ncbi:MAG: Gfo/Idh/MocA family oxidoreductase [Tannerellaceae bacterium]|jgi:predicted dehydrogenase|nr:Gfo/Idh/MocA family oxidoreductase [Tannerellaceae bacterium]
MRKSKTSLSRRQFIGKGMMAAAALTIVPRHVLGGIGYTAPSDEITLGFIGTGKQGRYLLTEFARRARVIAGSDVYPAKLDLFKEITEGEYAKRNMFAKGLKLYGDFRELLANKDIDAVVIATPDHWHAINVIEAAKAGKDVYCEKPYAHSIEEGRLMVKAIEQYGRINQTGNMQRSWKNFRIACQLVRNGHLGEIREVKVDVGPPPVKYDLKPEKNVNSINWDMWVGPAVYNEFNSELAPPIERDVYPNWRNYKEYGNGMTADWGAHMFDIAQWALGKDDSGPVAVYPPDKDHKHLTFVYDNGIVMTHESFGRGAGVRFIGTKGMLDISREYLEAMPSNLLTHKFADSEIKLYESNDHYRNWLDCIKTRQQPISTAEIGHRTTTVCLLANICYELQRPLHWNPVKEEFENDSEANKLRSGFVRKPWKLG